MSPMVIIVFLIVASVALVAYALMPKNNEDKDAIIRRMRGKRAVDEKAELKKTAKSSVTQKVVEKMAPFATRPVMPKTAEAMTKLSSKLCAGGFRKDNATTLFLASKTIMAVLFAIGGLLFALSRNEEAIRVLGWTISAAGLGFMAPNIWLGSAISKRGKEISQGLPDALDLLVISVESGLALDAAIQRVGDEMKNVHPILSEEFQICTLESQMGIPRAEALHNMAIRTAVAEIRSLTGIVNQADRFGTSVATALRNQADALRVRRRQEAEERAQQTTVKLMAPLILFIFPAIFVVLAGPAALKLIDTMGSATGL